MNIRSIRPLLISAITFILTSSPLVMAQSDNSERVAHYHFTTSNLKMTDASFRRYGMRQLRSIQIEYFYIIKKLAPEADELIQMRQRLSRMLESTISLQKKCPHSFETCRPELQELYRASKNLDQMILRTQEERLRFIDAKNETELDIRLEVYANLTKIAQMNQKLMHSLEFETMLSETPFAEKQAIKVEHRHLLYRAVLLAEMNMTALLGDPLKDEFYHLWINFIKVIDEEIIKNRDKQAYITKLEGLNKSWNTFHKNLSKAHNKKMDSSTLGTLRIMHNRWNSILKLMLR